MVTDDFESALVTLERVHARLEQLEGRKWALDLAGVMMVVIMLLRSINAIIVREFSPGNALMVLACNVLVLLPASVLGRMYRRVISRIQTERRAFDELMQLLRDNPSGAEGLRALHLLSRIRRLTD